LGLFVAIISFVDYVFCGYFVETGAFAACGILRCLGYFLVSLAVLLLLAFRVFRCYSAVSCCLVLSVVLFWWFCVVIYRFCVVGEFLGFSCFERLRVSVFLRFLGFGLVMYRDLVFWWSDAFFRCFCVV